MKKIQNLGKEITKQEQKVLMGGTGENGSCSVSLDCPSELGGGSITCSGTLGRCHRYPTQFKVQCDTDPAVTCYS